MGLFSNPIKDLDEALSGMRTNFCANNGRLDVEGVVSNRSKALEAISKANKRGKRSEAEAMLIAQQEEPVTPTPMVFFRADRVDSSGKAFDDAAEKAKAQLVAKKDKPLDPEVLKRMSDNWGAIFEELLEAAR